MRSPITNADVQFNVNNTSAALHLSLEWTAGRPDVITFTSKVSSQNQHFRSGLDLNLLFWKRNINIYQYLP